MVLDFSNQLSLDSINSFSVVFAIIQGIIVLILAMQQYRASKLAYKLEEVKIQTAKIEEETGILQSTTAAISVITEAINIETAGLSKKTETIKSETAGLNKYTESVNNEIVLIRKTSTSIDQEISLTNFGTSKINKDIAESQLNIEKLKLEYLKEETKYKRDSLEQIEKNSSEISDKIAQKLVENPTWLDRFMDETGATYVGSIFGKRINHFHYEKKSLAKKAIDYLEDEMKNSKTKVYCLLIDSGTTMYHLFSEITKRVTEAKRAGNSDIFNMWIMRVFIVTNNLPGIQYMMKHCRDTIDEYAEVYIKCLLLPGKPLSTYGAVTGSETVDFLTKWDKENKLHEKQELHIRTIIKENLKATNYEIISFITGNYVVRHQYENRELKDSYCPVARGGGHIDIKNEFVKLSDKICILSPLTKFSFATCDELNTYNEFQIDEESQPVDAEKTPSKVKYREIELLNKKEYKEKCIFFITSREQDDMFENFSKELASELNRCYNPEKRSKKVIIDTEYKIKNFIPFAKNSFAYRDIEAQKEIPHMILRQTYHQLKGNGHFIWDISWIDRIDKPEKTNYLNISCTD
jgi:hypothetical protein